MWFAKQANVHVGNTYRIRSGNLDVSRNYLQSLLPIVARECGKDTALTLLIAYLRDEAGDEWLPDLSITPKEPAASDADILECALDHMCQRAQSDARYADHIITQYLLSEHSELTLVSELLAQWHENQARTGDYLAKHQTITEAPPEEQLVEAAGVAGAAERIAQIVTALDPESTPNPPAPAASPRGPASAPTSPPETPQRAGPKPSNAAKSPQK
jgi:hypothetical protein